MNAIIRNLVILVAVMLTVLSINLNPASAQSIADCASQEGCIAATQVDQVLIYRKGVLKGAIQPGAIQPGAITDEKISARKGWIVVTSTNADFAIYNVATGALCAGMLMGPCTESTTVLHEETSRSRVFISCPGANQIATVTLDCSSVEFSSTNINPSSVTHYKEYKVLVLNAGSWNMWGYNVDLMQGWGVTVAVDNPIKVRYWNNGSDPAQMFFNSPTGIYWKEADPEYVGGAPTPLFYATPAATHEMVVNDTHVLAATPSGSANAYLIEIANPTTHVTLPVALSMGVALSKENAFVLRGGADGGIDVFDLSGNPLYTIDGVFYSIAYIAPTLPPVCSNNLVEPGEICDGTDFDGLDCTDYGFDAGALTCSPSCDAIFASGCWRCGDGTMNPGEYCDGDDLGEASCAAAGYANGTVSCTPSCTVDYSQCYTCNNGLIEGAEECEGADLQGATCESEGFVGGTLTCTDCMLDTSACHMCGNDFTDEGELCDGTHTPGKICQTMGAGYTSGQLLCASGCATYDTSACNTCGDGVVNSPEECDGENLGEQTCASLGLSSGTLSCFQNCTFNFNGCSGVQTEYCGNGNIDPGEECDDGNRSNSDDCSEFCKIIPPTCGVGGIDAGEECDGEELGDATCESLGYEAGVLYCGGDCRLRTDGCTFVSVPQSIQLTLGGEPESGELNPALKTQYEDLKSTLTYNCISQEVNGDLVITTTEGSYCAVRAHDLDTGDKLFSFIYIPENPLERESPVVRFYQNGTIAQNFGGQINAFQGLQIKTVLVQDRLYNVTQDRISSMGMRFLAVHPETQSRGRWLALNVGVGSTKFCTDESGDTCALFIPKQGELVLNLDNLEDLSEIGWKTPKDPGGCSCTTGTNNNSTSLPLLFSALAMALLFLRRRRNRVR